MSAAARAASHTPQDTGPAALAQQHLPSGAFRTTKGADTGEAVYSRPAIIGSELVPSQYAGNCQMENWP